MPSTLPGCISGGEPLVSGNPFSGRPIPYTGVKFYVDPAASGNVYIGFSGGVTIQSGGGMSSGGLFDGMIMPPGTSQSFPIPGGGLSSIYLAVTSGVSGAARVYWHPYGGGL